MQHSLGSCSGTELQGLFRAMNSGVNGNFRV